MTDGHYEFRIDDADLTSNGETIVLRIFMAIMVIPTVFLIFYLATNSVFNY